MANYKIRQEINILNRELVNPTGDADLAEIIDYDPANYNGETVYFEVVAKNTDGTNVLYVNVHDSSHNEHESLTIPINTSSYALIRSAIDTTLTDDTYHVHIEDNTAAWDTNGSIKLARLVILQDAADIIDTQTQIEVGCFAEELTTTTEDPDIEPIAEPKIWKYESAKWDPAPTFTFACTMRCENDKGDIWIGLEQDDGAFNWSGSMIIQAAIKVADEVVKYYESASFSPTDGRHYRVAIMAENDAYGEFIYNAKVIATQGSSVSKLQNEYLMINEAQADTGLQKLKTQWDPAEWNDGADGLPDMFHEHSADSAGSNTELLEYANDIFIDDTSPASGLSLLIYGGSGSYEECAHYFTTPNDGISYKLIYFLIGIYIYGSPSDNLLVRLTTTLGDTPISTTIAFDLTTAVHNDWNKLEFPSPQSLSPNTKYYLEYYRSGSRDTSDYLGIRRITAGDGQAGAGWAQKANGSWGSEDTEDPILIAPGYLDITNSDITGDDLTRGGTKLTMPATAKEIDSYIVTA